MSLEQQLADLQQQNAALTQAVNSLVATYTNKANDISVAALDAVNAFNATVAALDSPGHSNRRRVIYISATGDDSAAGTIDAPVQSWQAVCDKLAQNGLNDIFFLSDVTIDKSVKLWSSPGKLRLYGWDKATGATAKRVVTIADDGDSPGGVFVYGSMSVESSNLDYQINSTASYGVFTAIGCNCAVKFDNATITAAAGATVLFYLSGGSNGFFDFTSTVIDASAQGHIFSGVAAATDPNAKLNITSTLQSA